MVLLSSKKVWLYGTKISVLTSALYIFICTVRIPILRKIPNIIFVIPFILSYGTILQAQIMKNNQYNFYDNINFYCLVYFFTSPPPILLLPFGIFAFVHVVKSKYPPPKKVRHPIYKSILKYKDEINSFALILQFWSLGFGFLMTLLGKCNVSNLVALYFTLRYEYFHSLKMKKIIKRQNKILKDCIFGENFDLKREIGKLKTFFLTMKIL